MTTPLLDLGDTSTLTNHPAEGCFARSAHGRREQRRAIYSRGERYRYTLEIRWAPGKLVQWIGCNPSKATELRNDPTVTRCIDYAKRWGAGAIVVTNVCAYRATDPKDMRAEADPIGPGNTPEFLASFEAWKVVGCWGTNPGMRPDLVPHVQAVKRAVGSRLLALGITKGGQPRHPLRMDSHLQPIAFAELAAELARGQGR